MSDDRREWSFSRRRVLAAVAATGATGALTGVGASAYFTDEERFTGALLTAGGLDLRLCWEREGEDCEPTDDTLALDIDGSKAGSATIRCRLPDDEANNPAWFWLRTSCPEDACGLEDAVRLTVWYDENCDSRRDEGERFLTASDGTAIRDLRLCEALSLLREGVQLDGEPSETGDVAPHEPGEDCCLGVAWTVDDRCIPSDDSLSVTFEFHGTQVRHTDPENPWPADPCTVDCDDTDDCERCPDGVPASFVAFCAPSEPIAMNAITHLSWTDDTVTWESDTDIETVVLYYGQPTFENFTRSSGYEAGTRYTVERGTGEVLSREEAGAKYGQEPRDPCPDRDDDGCGVRYNFDEAVWDCVCGPPGPDRHCGGDGDE